VGSRQMHAEMTESDMKVMLGRATSPDADQSIAGPALKARVGHWKAPEIAAVFLQDLMTARHDLCPI